MIRRFIYSSTTVNNSDIGDSSTTRVTVNQAFHKDYPTMDDIFKAIATKKKMSTVTNLLTRASTGLGDLPLIEIEAEWYNLVGEVEKLELEDLQGVSGLKALRVEVLYKNDFNEKTTMTIDQLIEDIKA